MCLLKVKEEETYEPARVSKRTTRVRRYESPPRVQEQRSSYYHREEHNEPLPLPPAPSTYKAETVRSRRTSRAPSVRAPSVRAPSVRSTTRSHYVEVEDETSESSESSEDVRSRATSHRTKKSSRAPRSVAPPASEYSIHEREKEIRRERLAPREPEYETYRYVNAPRDARSSGQDVVRREKERITIEDGYGKRTSRDYRR
ncbi:hypothetical protein LTR17_006708 [Elasticomyces elasticus]|nr:hypothetical protein LTR17_006708 [Elasticomyces elasticus]